MARHGYAEIAAGAGVLVVAAGFLAYAVANTGKSAGHGYSLVAKFERIDGLVLGSDVRVAGVKVGSVTGTSIDPQQYRAVVSFTVQDDIHLPTDSSAEVTSDGLLGGKYLALVPGGADAMLRPGQEMTVTSGSVSLEQLLGKFIFSTTDLVNALKTQSTQGGQVPGGQVPGGQAAPGATPGAATAPR